MTEPMPQLASASEIRALAHRALEVLDAAYAMQPHYTDRAASARQTQTIRAVVEAMRFCSHAAGLLGDPSLMPELAEAVEAFDTDDYAAAHTEALGIGVTELLAAGAPIDAHVRALAACKHDSVREAVASGLRTDRPDALALLETLASDPVAGVRKVARERLAKVREVPWWIGKFARDPLVGLEPAHAAELAPTFARVSELMDMPAHTRSTFDGELATLADKLPDALALDMLERALLGTNHWARRRSTALLGAIAARPGAGAVIERLIVRWSAVNEDYAVPEQVAAVVAPLASDARERLARELLAATVGRPAGEHGAVYDGAAVRLAACTAVAWPTELDPTPVLDAALAMPVPEGDTLDHVATELSRVLATTTHVGEGPVLARVLAARLSNYAGAWRSLERDADIFLKRVEGPLVRPTVEAALQNGEGTVLTWALERLVIGPAWDATRDPPRAELAQRLFADARYRAAFIQRHDVAMAVTPALRRRLRDGDADLATADMALVCVEALWGVSDDGAPRPSSFRRRARGESDAERDARRQQELSDERARWQEFLGPPALQGPATDDEWERYRGARERAVITEYLDWLRAMQMFPPGPISVADRAFIRRGFDYARATDPTVAMPVAIALAAHCTVDELPLFDELEAIDAGEDDSDVYEFERKAAYERLGIERPRGDDAKGDEGDEGDAWEDDEGGDDDGL